jgi:hypothetical protein
VVSYISTFPDRVFFVVFSDAIMSNNINNNGFIQYNFVYGGIGIPHQKL